MAPIFSPPAAASNIPSPIEVLPLVAEDWDPFAATL